MITRVLAVGLLAGLLAGLAVASLQAYTTTPIILEAEVFENGATAPQGSASLNTAPRLYRDIGEARVILVHDGEDPFTSRRSGGGSMVARRRS